MPDVAKLKKRALEYEQKKQFDKALDTYTQVLAELDEHVDEADVALYNRVGDLLLRRGDVSEAVDHYEKAVDLYTDGGFFNNAIALCNKILRNAPGRNSVYYKLGKISARKGFINDAKQNFLEYADRMQKAGQLEEAFRALKEFADLCPDQDDIRLMLADQLVRKDRKSEAIEQLHALYDKFSAEGRSAEARATVDRMKALDPALEPKEVARAAPAKAGDLVFLDVNYDEPSRPITSSAPVVPPPTPAPTPAPAPASPPVAAAEKPAWKVEHPATPSETQAIAIEMPKIVPDEDILIDLHATQDPEIEALPGISHGAELSVGKEVAEEEIVSHVDEAFITGFEESAIAGADEALTIEPLSDIEHHSHVDGGPLEGLEPISHLELSEVPDVLTADAEAVSLLADMDLPSLSSTELPSLELDDTTPSGGELPMLDVPLEDTLDDGVTVGGSLTFLSIDEPAADSAAPADDEAPMFEHATDALIIEPPAAAPRRSGSVSLDDDFGDMSLEVERSPTLEMDVIVPDGGPPLPLLDLDEQPGSSFDRDNALSGLPMLEAHQTAPLESADEDVEEDTVEEVWPSEPPPKSRPIVRWDRARRRRLRFHACRHRLRCRRRSAASITFGSTSRTRQPRGIYIDSSPRRCSRRAIALAE